MSKLFFHIGGTGIPDSVMLDYAVEQAEMDPAFEADAHITFTDADQFFSILTPERIRLLRYIHEHGRVQSVRALAAALGRDYANVHADVAVLVKHGLLEKEGTALTLITTAPAEQPA